MPEIPLEIALLISTGTFIFALLWSFLMASRVAPPRAKRLIVQTLSDSTSPEVAAVRAALIEPETAKLSARLGVVRADIDSRIRPLRIPPMPPGLDNLSSRMETFEAELEGFRADMKDTILLIKADIETLPAKLDARFQNLQLAASGQEARAFQAAVSGSEAEIKAALSVREAMAQQDPEMMRLAIMRKVSEAKVSDKYAEEHPVGAMLIEAGRAQLLQFMAQGEGLFGGRGSGPHRPLPAKRPVDAYNLR